MFRKAIDKSFTPKWWFYLLSCGILLGFSVSVKLVGLFMVAYIGVWTINDLWKMMEFLPQVCDDGNFYLKFEAYFLQFNNRIHAKQDFLV